MNIFALDLDAAEAARYHCDRHVLKMIVESACLLSTVQKPGPEHVYRGVSQHNPCVRWLQSSRANYAWMYLLALTLCQQYRQRFRRTHGNEGMLLGPLGRMPSHLPAVERTPHVQQVPSAYRVQDDPVLAYRLYYIGLRAHLSQWTKPASRPLWIDSVHELFNEKGLPYVSPHKKYA